MPAPYMQNRELSWLRFNERVLAEAADESVPLLERLKFLSIFTSNLDEFFMIRVGSLFDLQSVNAEALDSKTGMTPKEQLDKLYASVHPLIKKRDEVYFTVEQMLRKEGIVNLSTAELCIEEFRFVKQYYEQEIAPILSPQIVDSHHPFPHLQSKVLHIGAVLKEEEKTLFGVIPVPASLPDIIQIPGTGVRYVRVEDIILDHVEQVFSMYRIAEKTIFCITRNADIHPDDEAFDVNQDFRSKMQKLLQHAVLPGRVMTFKFWFSRMLKNPLWAVLACLFPFFLTGMYSFHGLFNPEVSANSAALSAISGNLTYAFLDSFFYTYLFALFFSLI